MSKHAYRNGHHRNGTHRNGVSRPREVAVSPAQQALARGLQHHQGGRLAEAEAIYRQVLAADPANAPALHLLGVLANQVGQPAAAVELISHAVEIEPLAASYHSNLGNALQALGRLDEALTSYQQALVLQPTAADTWINLGAALQVAGRPADAADAFRRALALDPTSAMAHSSLIFVLDLLPEAIEEARAERRRFDERFGQGWRTDPILHINSDDSERRLRIGYVSADFRDHSAASAILPILRSHDHSQVEVVCYSGVTGPDAVTAEFRSLADRWHDTAHLSDDALAALIREDRIDVLVDLSGHSAGNRLPVFGRKPAPVQVTAWGYVAGTGLTAIDAFLADPVVVPPSERGHFAEAVVDLPSAICFEPPADLPPVTPLPAREHGAVTFGSFHRLARLTPEVLDLWAQVVAAAPESRMLLKCAGLDDPTARERVLEAFARHGVGPERLTLLGATTRREHLAAFARVDLQLDTFPQSGGVTTLEGLAMGVPSVTLLGQGITGRISASFLASLGLHDLIAQTPEAYVEMAVRATSDPDRLSRERATLRDRLLASPVGDAKAYTRAVEDVYRALRRTWCARGAAR